MLTTFTTLYQGARLVLDANGFRCMKADAPIICAEGTEIVQQTQDEFKESVLRHLIARGVGKQSNKLVFGEGDIGR